MYYDDIIEEMLLEDYLNNYFDELLIEAYLEGINNAQYGNIPVKNLDKQGQRAYKNYVNGKARRTPINGVLSGVNIAISASSARNAVRGVKQLKKINNPEEFDKMYEKYLTNFENNNNGGQPKSKEEYKKYLKKMNGIGLAGSALSMGIGAKSVADVYKSSNRYISKNKAKLDNSVERYRNHK